MNLFFKFFILAILDSSKYGIEVVNLIPELLKERPTVAYPFPIPCNKMDYPHSEEEVRQALEAYVKSTCCTGSTPAKEMKIHDIQPVHAFRYILDTLMESRILESKREPFTNQYVDGLKNGPSPDKWSVLCRPSEPHSGSSTEIPLPHSASVMDCEKCHVTGYTSCDTCKCLGFKKCSSCNGRGKHVRSASTSTQSNNTRRDLVGRAGRQTRQLDFDHLGSPQCHPCEGPQAPEDCSSCDGMGRKNCHKCEIGRIQCKNCMGHKYFKHWQVIKIAWTSETITYITERGKLHRELLANATSAEVIYNELCPGSNPRPVSGVSDSGIIEASQRIMSHKCGSQNYHKKILQFRQRVEIIPVVKVTFDYKGNVEHFFVYGNERSVYFPEGYPDQGCFSACSVI